MPARKQQIRCFTATRGNPRRLRAATIQVISHTLTCCHPVPSCAPQLLNRRDPSGTSPRFLSQQFPKAQPKHLLDDHDLVYTTEQSPPQTATLPDLPTVPVASSVGGEGLVSPRRATSPPKAQLQQSARFEFQRRGQRAGDVGWGCVRPNLKETQQNGRIDGHALVSSDLHKKYAIYHAPVLLTPRLRAFAHDAPPPFAPPHFLGGRHQFMRLSGDPSFDKRAGKLVLTAGSLRKPDNLMGRK